jgi:hypothetical protein
MDILVCIPPDKEEHVLARKLNPIVGGLTHGYWMLPKCPKFAKKGDRIWFSIFGDVIASARIISPEDSFPAGGERVEDRPEGGEYKPAVCFNIPTVMGHEFGMPCEFPLSFKGFRYVRRANKHVSVKRTHVLEFVEAEKAEKLYPKSW